MVIIFSILFVFIVSSSFITAEDNNTDILDTGEDSTPLTEDQTSQNDDSADEEASQDSGSDESHSEDSDDGDVEFDMDVVYDNENTADEQHSDDNSSQEDVPVVKKTTDKTHEVSHKDKSDGIKVSLTNHETGIPFLMALAVISMMILPFRRH